MKNNIARIVAGIGVLGFAMTASLANAQLFPYDTTTTASSTATTTAATSTDTSTAVTTAATATPIFATSTGTSSLVAVNGPTGGNIQFNHVVVSNISAITVPADITAGNTTDGTVNMFGQGTCLQFADQNTTTGTPVACPILGSVGAATTSVTSAAPYTIHVDASTQILLSDRSVGTLANISNGDQINVYGAYNATGDGSIQAYIIRDLSKPSIGNTIPTATPLPTDTSGMGTVLGVNTTTVTGTATTMTIQQIIVALQQIIAAINLISAQINGTSTTLNATTTMTPTSTVSSTLGY